jgi:cellulose synthase/poly-beta-1,6-N-acetylglucosamine synthase-like glycosyltransferase
MIETILIFATVLYSMAMLYLRFGLARADNKRRNDNYEPTVSVIVAARNEEESIGECLLSLSRLEYPPEKLELIIVNDGSVDKTKAITEGIVSSHPWMKLVSTSPGTGNLRGKPNAVAQGIEASRGEILMFTDADCTVQPEWVKETVRSFDNETGVVGGFTLLEAHRTFEGIQTLDWLFLFGLASASAGLGTPLTVIGNNLAVRRAAYDSTGGFKDIPFSVTEDYALVQSILKKTNYKVRFPVNPKTLVMSKPCADWNRLFRQKQRWWVGGLDMILWGVVLMLIGWTSRISLILGLFAGSPLVVLAGLASVSLMDMILLWKPLKSFGRLAYLRYLPAYEIYFILCMLILPVVALSSRNVVWKERKLEG